MQNNDREQEILIAKTIGCSRFVFNYFLAQWNDTYKNTGKGLTYNICSSRLTQLKKVSMAKRSGQYLLAVKVQSYTTKHTNGNIAINGNKIKFPKLGLVRVVNTKTRKLKALPCENGSVLLAIANGIGM
ncbi:transposase and inactivated derivative [Paenibacillus popilliae ATCC 14706]|uniref:Transposase and inactivated derivative n=1 Tax=Paenibacillus popilliae ATCC 14706 TaxID=1212764 RepID=M9LCX2_PAEPP|nr:transposase and inactivated derivative [Paenibacillus popilliae ATCC 14706]